jgi:hypothetical protein
MVRYLKMGDSERGDGLFMGIVTCHGNRDLPVIRIWQEPVTGDEATMSSNIEE